MRGSDAEFTAWAQRHSVAAAPGVPAQRRLAAGRGPRTGTLVRLYLRLAAGRPGGQPGRVTPTRRCSTSSSPAGAAGAPATTDRRAALAARPRSERRPGAGPGPGPGGAQPPRTLRDRRPYLDDRSVVDVARMVQPDPVLGPHHGAPGAPAAAPVTALSTVRTSCRRVPRTIMNTTERATGCAPRTTSRSTTWTRSSPGPSGRASSGAAYASGAPGSGRRGCAGHGGGSGRHPGGPRDGRSFHAGRDDDANRTATPRRAARVTSADFWRGSGLPARGNDGDRDRSWSDPEAAEDMKRNAVAGVVWRTRTDRRGSRSPSGSSLTIPLTAANPGTAARERGTAAESGRTARRSTSTRTGRRGRGFGTTPSVPPTTVRTVSGSSSRSATTSTTAGMSPGPPVGG